MVKPYVKKTRYKVKTNHELAEFGLNQMTDYNENFIRLNY